MARNGPHIQKYTPERVKRLTDAVALGATRILACKYAGVDTYTVQCWERRHPEFHAAMVEAEGRGGIGWLAKIEKAANDGNWQAAAWKLERRYPHEYGRTVHEHQVTNMQEKTDAELEAIARGESPGDP